MKVSHEREIQLRNDLGNLCFHAKYIIGVLAELEQLGRTHTREFKRAEENLRILQHNIKRVEKELEAEEIRVFDAELDDERYLTAGFALA